MAGQTQAGSYGLGVPTPVIVSHSQGFSVPLSGPIAGTASDAGIGVRKVEVRIQRASDNKFWNGSRPGSLTPTSGIWRPVPPAGPIRSLPARRRRSPITVRATDGLNLVAQTAINSSGAPIDTTPPTTSSNAAANYYNTPGQVITLTRSEAGTTEYRLGGSGSYISGTSVAVPTTIGTYTLIFRSTDTAGNPESPDKSATFNVVAAPVPVTYGTSTSIRSSRSSVKVRKSLTIYGSVAPAGPGRVKITKQRKVGRKWKSAGTGYATVVNGSYRYTFKPSRKGSWRFVATYSGGVSGITTYNGSRSGTKGVRVK